MSTNDRAELAPPYPVTVTPQLQTSRRALALAMRHHRSGRLAEAIEAYDQAMAAEPDLVAAHVNKGAALRGLGRLPEAMACYWRAVALAPRNLEAWCNAGNALLDQGRIEEAQAALESARRLGPMTSEVWTALGRLLALRNKTQAAIPCVRRAVALTPGNAAAWRQLAGLQEKTDPQAALKAYAELHRLMPADPAGQCGLARALIRLGRLDEAESILRRALDLDDRLLEAHLGLAHLLLLKGDLAAGWPEYEWRRRRPSARQPKPAGPEWDGGDPAGKCLLVHGGENPADTLQFLRYLPKLAAMGGRIVLVCEKALQSLAGRVEGVVAVHTSWKGLPPFDAWVPLSSLPLKFGTGLETIPPPSTLPMPSAPLSAPLGTRLRVGLAWAGNDPDHAPGLAALLPLAGLAGIAPVSLQTGPQAAALETQSHPALIAPPPRPLNDYADLASVIAGLDLVITADGPLAHLAGAMGKAVWVLVPFSPDWRWMTEREDSPWYPTMRLFRQTETGDWAAVVERMVKELERLAASRPLPAAEEAEILVHSVFPQLVHHEDTEDTEKEKMDMLPPAAAKDSSPCLRGEPTPRFRMVAPRSFLPDPGIRFLVHRERAGIGYEYATRSFIDAHIEPGDLFIDVGAHWGIMSLQAVTRWPGQVDALAIEPSPRNLPHLKRWVDENGLANRIEIVGAAASDTKGRGELRPESTMGHSLITSEAGSIPVVTIDGLLAERPHLDHRRVIVKIDVEGFETEVVDGMKDLLASGRVAAVIWERGIEYDKPVGLKRLKALRASFDKLGFTAWRFASEDEAGPLEPFGENGRKGNIIELAPGVETKPAYGRPRPAPIRQPDDPATDAALEARAAFLAGLARHRAGKAREALIHYAKAAALDATISELFNNLGVALRDLGRPAAAEACYRRAMALNPEETGVLSNLGNVLRELGRLDEAEEMHARALARQPGNPGVLYNAGSVQRDAGRPEKALALFERALDRNPENRDLRWDHALALLQAGDYERGFPAYESRWGLNRAKKRKIDLPRWDGSPLDGRSIFLTDEQGFGDVLQFARFIPEVKKRGAGRLVLECQPELMRLLALAPGVDAVTPREKGSPDCDVTLPLLSLPGLFAVTLDTLPAAVPYLAAPEPACILPHDGRLKLGLVWAGKPTPRDRSCPLDTLLPLLDDPRIAPFSLQVGPRAADLKKLGADLFISDLSPMLPDFAETAAVLKQLDLLVTVDTAIAHLAGALGVRTFLLLRYTSDWRWFDRGTTSPWYPSFTLFRQKVPNRWDEAIMEVGLALSKVGL